MKCISDVKFKHSRPTTLAAVKQIKLTNDLVMHIFLKKVSFCKRRVLYECHTGEKFFSTFDSFDYFVISKIILMMGMNI